MTELAITRIGLLVLLATGGCYGARSNLGEGSPDSGAGGQAGQQAGAQAGEGGFGAFAGEGVPRPDASVGPPSAGTMAYMGEACRQGEVLNCACEGGGAGRKVCRFDPDSPTQGSFSECGNCQPVVGMQCQRDDDGRIDTGAAEACAQQVLNAVSACVVQADGTPTCILVQCYEGFWDCDGTPGNGCECEVDETDAGT